MATNIGQVKVLHLASNRVHYYNFGTWANHRRIEKQSGKKMYKLLKTIPSSGANTSSRSTSVNEEKEEENTTKRGILNSLPPPPKRRKKGCNC